MIGKSKIQPIEREYGEQLTIRKPDMTSTSDVVVEKDPIDRRFDLSPEHPSHVPTPATIDGGLNEIQRQLQAMFTTDDGGITPAKKRSQRRKHVLSPTNEPTPVTPDHSPYSTKATKIVIASSNGSKWGPDVWKSKMRPSFSRPTHINNQPPSPSDVVGELNNAKEQFNSSKTSPKVIMSEKVVETVERNNRNQNQKRYSASPLQLQWIEENALNLHSSCQNLSQHGDPSARRSRFMFRPRPRMASFT